MSKTLQIVIGIVILVVAVSVFYWFQWRPNQIKQRCYAEAEFDKRAILETDAVKRKEFINTYYENCLMRFGLK